jgi:hypothetical protein
MSRFRQYSQAEMAAEFQRLDAERLQKENKEKVAWTAARQTAFYTCGSCSLNFSENPASPALASEKIKERKWEDWIDERGTTVADSASQCTGKTLLATCGRGAWMTDAAKRAECHWADRQSYSTSLASSRAQ